jgi:hypothetical protein
VEERRFACSGGDLFPDGQGSERQDISEPIGPSRVDSERGKSFALAAPVLLPRFNSGQLDEEGKEEEAGGGSGSRQQAGSGRGRNGRQKDTKIYTSSGAATFAHKGCLFKEFCFSLRLAFIDA